MTIDHEDKRDRNPFQTFLFLLSLVASVPLLTGNAGSALLEEELDDKAVVLWGFCLMAGTLLGLIGQWWPKMLTWNAFAFERAGVSLTGVAATVYAVVIISSTNDFTSVSYVFSVQIGFAVACLARAWQLGNRMKRMKHTRVRG